MTGGKLTNCRGGQPVTPVKPEVSYIPTTPVPGLVFCGVFTTFCARSCQWPVSPVGLLLRPDHVMGMEGGMGPPGSQNSMGPSNSEGSMYSPSRYPSQQRSASVCVCYSALVNKIKTIVEIKKKKIHFQWVISLVLPLVCFRHDGYSQQYPSMPYGMHPSGMYSQQQVRNHLYLDSETVQ